MMNLFFPRWRPSQQRFAAEKSRRGGGNRLFFRPLLEQVEDRLLPANIVWSGAVSSTWSVPGNWQGGLVPGPADRAAFDTSAANRTAVVDANYSGTVGGLSSSWPGQIVLDRALSVSADFLLAQGTITGSGLLTLNGTSRWEDGTLSGAGTTVVPADGSLTLSGPAYKYLSQRMLSNAGTITWTGTGAILPERGSIINNLAGATFDAQTDSYITAAGPAGSFTNSGTFRKSAGTGTLSVQVLFRNTGLVDVRSGMFGLSGSGSSDGSFSTTEATAVVFPSNQYTLSDGAAATGAGFARVTGGTLLIDGNVQAQNISLETGAIDGLGNLTTTGTFNWTGGTMTGRGTTTIATTAVLAISGSEQKFFGQRTLANAGNASWSGAGGIGTGDGGSILNEAGAVFDIQNDTAFFPALGTPYPMFTNAGTLRKSVGTGTSTFLFMDFSNAGTVEATSGTLYMASAFSNFSGSTLTAGTYRVSATFQFNGARIGTNAANLTLDGPGARLVDQFGRDALADFSSNTGSFTLQNDRNFTTSGDWSTAGAVTIGAGTFMTNGDYSQTGGATLLANATLAARSGNTLRTVSVRGGTLSGSGTIDANVVIDGQIIVGDATNIGQLTITGDYTQTGSLTIKIAGTDDGTFDRLVVQGQASFAEGTLNVVMLNGFLPDPTNPDRFPIITFGAHNSGDDFAVYNGLDLGDGLTLTPIFDGPSLVLVASRTDPN
jgi:hypothetical protein